jgi:glycosyltransferase involved in cell wall biosynthesis
MKIAQLAPLAEAVPPKLYGGTERVVSWLTEELVALGHEVTLFASGDSHSNAELDAATPAALRLAPEASDAMLAYGAQLAALAERARDFDVVHAHIDWLHIPLLTSLGVPFLTTLHGRLDLPDLAEAIARFERAPFVSISTAQREPLPNVNWIGTVHHGIPERLFTPNHCPERYLAFLGRISPEKGPVEAIGWARAAGLPLKIAAKVDDADRAYFEEAVKPEIERGDGVDFVGEIGEAEKCDFLGNAAALLFPICWPEPFGLVMVEAMACGTPVIAFRSGSVAEIVEDGVSGFVIAPGDTKGALDAIAKLDRLDRRRVRASFVRGFTARRMAQDYLSLYSAFNSNGR